MLSELKRTSDKNSLDEGISIRRRSRSLSITTLIPLQYHKIGTFISIRKFDVIGSVTYYTISILQLVNGSIHSRKKVMKRYSEFRSLLQSLLKEHKSAFDDCVSFPKRSFWNRLSVTLIEKRKDWLDRWLKFVVLHPVLLRSEAFIAFLSI